MVHWFMMEDSKAALCTWWSLSCRFKKEFQEDLLNVTLRSTAHTT